jgi:hypothetical protein
MQTPNTSRFAPVTSWTALVCCVLWVLGAASAAVAQQPTSQVLTFTGRMPGQLDGSVAVRLRLYDASPGGTLRFEETQTVQVISETFTVRVGDATAGGVPAPVFRDNSSLWIAFALDSTPDMEIGPRTAITSGGYAHAAALLTSPMVRTVNGLVGDVVLAPGSNVTITPTGNTVTIDASPGLTNVAHDGTLVGTGAGGAPLGVAAPLALTSTQLAPAISGTNSGSAAGVFGQSSGGPGVSGFSASGLGVRGESGGLGAGVLGTSSSGEGVYGTTNGGANVAGVKGVAAAPGGNGVWGVSAGSGTQSVGVRGDSSGGIGVYGTTNGDASVAGVKGVASSHGGNGVWGLSADSAGVYGVGVRGVSSTGTGVIAESTSNVGLHAMSKSSNGVVGLTSGDPTVAGVLGIADSGGRGVQGESRDGTGVYGQSTNYRGVEGISFGGIGVYGWGPYAGYFAGRVRVTQIPPGASSGQVCFNPQGDLLQCSSSLRFKTNVEPFRGGLDIVRRLQPIRFDWKEGGGHDVGFGAEDVERVEPLLVTRDRDGEIAGVKYDRLSAVFVNALAEQQAQIQRQQDQIAALQALVCSLRPDADVCR